MPGIVSARPQLPFRWVARYGTANSRVLEPAAAVRNPYPAAVQLPGAAHEMDATSERWRLMRAAAPRISRAVPQTPLTWLTTTERSGMRLNPPALQSPAAAHEILVIQGCPRLLPAGTLTFWAAPQTPLTWLTTSFAAAPQLPGEAHDTSVIPAVTPILRMVPGIFLARPQVPLTWLITKPSDRQHPGEEKRS